ncbi:MAG: hypothetical protein RMI34_06115 [Chloroherpetonaceae bacterium]|nr:hypothetical protein [Chloroherpetonaceae bacterium]MCS7210524.1 hypothetical protein [Chloroherpetonaceae bacterium]MDW8019634.1 hypothetical protein [Chloroherpetonaceae bacterium]MDW8467163.1 hypothetical protein [Chloroherpetonaceae bacterium]
MLRRSDIFFMLSAFVAFVLANMLLIQGKLNEALFVSLWVPTNLVMGIYFRNIATTAPKE